MSSTGAVGTDRQYDATMLGMHREVQLESLNRLRQTLSSRENTLTTKLKIFLALSSHTLCLMNSTVSSNSHYAPSCLRLRMREISGVVGVSFTPQRSRGHACRVHVERDTSRDRWRS